MNIDLVPLGDDPPRSVNVIIEVPIGGEPIKYEMDKKSGALVVDRFLYTSMRYPGNYGFIPHTLSGDGDPCDVIVANTRALMPGAIISCRLVGVLLMEDEAGPDEKLLAVPSSWLTQRTLRARSGRSAPSRRRRSPSTTSASPAWPRARLRKSRSTGSTLSRQRCFTAVHIST